MTRINPNEIQDMIDSLGGLEEGETKNTFHCKHGHDNDRCFITHKGHIILAYCHHCHAKGSKRVANSYVKRALKPSVLPPARTSALPYDSLPPTSKWPVEANVWLSRGGVNTALAMKKGIVYSPSLNRVCIPVVFNGEYQGYSARRLKDDGSPKYLHRQKDREKFIYSCPAGTDSVVLVEDILSAIRVGEYTSAVAVQGTSLTDTLLEYLTQHYTSFIIWLDNDNRHVKLNQAKMLRQLQLYGDVRIIKTDKDPKEMTDAEITAHLT